MIAVWLGAVVALLAVLAYVARVADAVRTPVWPEEAPVQARDHRARDQQLSHLARLLAADDPSATHAVLVSVVAGLPEPARDDPAVRRFLDTPPATAERYRRELHRVLRRIEQL